MRGRQRRRRFRSTAARCNQRLTRPFDVGLRTGDAQEVAAVEHRVGRKRDLLAPRTSFMSITPRPWSAATSARVRSARLLVVSTTSRAATGKSSRRRSSTSVHRRGMGQHHFAPSADDRGVTGPKQRLARGLDELVAPADALTNTRSGANDRSNSATLRFTARELSRYGTHGGPTLCTRIGRPHPTVCRRPWPVPASGFRLSDPP